MMDILLVEDNPDDEELTLLTLKEKRLVSEIAVVRDGAEALDFIFCQGQYAERDPLDLPKLILLDLKLPKRSGMEVLERLKNSPQTKNIPVVALTSSREEPDVARCYALGVNSYIVKPVDYVQFREVIIQMGIYWHQINEYPQRQN